ncbi:hypothetical protein Tco_0629131 [Tanacetum coccineum]|uniref:Uncharacterized protein n=1 Tax=Tanacetum coccineum TaxID=301880 RepID=A0ABQ4WS88_9ASTR
MSDSVHLRLHTISSRRTIYTWVTPWGGRGTIYEGPPSPDYIPGPKGPPSPDYVPSPEEPEQEPPSPIYIPFVLEPSPGYIPESDPEEDLEEDDEEDLRMPSETQAPTPFLSEEVAERVLALPTPPPSPLSPYSSPLLRLPSPPFTIPPH